MNPTDEKLKAETVKWIEKIKPIVEKLSAVDENGQAMLTNMNAYINDSKHFLGREDYIRSFEAIIWAWAIYENCKELGVINEQ
jgi:uncharacterized protein